MLAIGYESKVLSQTLKIISHKENNIAYSVYVNDTVAYDLLMPLARVFESLLRGKYEVGEPFFFLGRTHC